MTQTQPEPIFDEAELAAVDAETEKLRAQLRMMAGAEPAAPAQSATPRPMAPQPPVPTPPRRAAAPVPPRPAPQPKMTAPPADQFVAGITTAIAQTIPSTWAYFAIGANAAARPLPLRTNASRAVEGAILCDLMQRLCNSTGQLGQATDAITNILHFLNSKGIQADAMSQMLNSCVVTFNSETEEERFAAINVVEQRSAPRWAWHMVDQVMRAEAQGTMGAVDLESACAANNAAIAMRLASRDPEIKELTVDELVGEPDYIEMEGRE